MKSLLLLAAAWACWPLSPARRWRPPPPAPFASVDPAPPGAEMPNPHGPRMAGPKGDRRSPPPPPPSKAAHFRLESGGVILDVKCADDEPMQACADIDLQLLDRAMAPEAAAPRP
jgi:hypothetical protein